MADHVFGRHAVLEALRSGRKLTRILVLKAGRRAPGQDEAIQLARQRDVPIRFVDRSTLDQISPYHQGLAAEVEPFPYVEVDELIALVRENERPPFLVVLDSVQDPQNFGTLLRTAAALGADGAIIAKNRAVGVTPAVERASAGAISRLLVGRATNLPRALDDLRSAGIWVYGVDAKAKDRFDQVDLTGPIAIVVGAEGAGLGRLVTEHCDRLIRIPMAGVIDSLNVAVAGSIILSEIFRQRERAGQAAEGVRGRQSAKVRLDEGEKGRERDGASDPVGEAESRPIVRAGRGRLAVSRPREEPSDAESERDDLAGRRSTRTGGRTGKGSRSFHLPTPQVTLSWDEDAAPAEPPRIPGRGGQVKRGSTSVRKEGARPTRPPGRSDDRRGPVGGPRRSGRR